MIQTSPVESPLADKTTPSSAVENVVRIPQTLSTLVDRAADLRGRAEATATDVRDLHRSVNGADLDRRRYFKAREGAASLLDQLTVEYGMSWSDIARAVGVTTQAIRKWRKGEFPSGENRLSLAKLTAFMDILSELGIQQPASWLEIPVVDGYSVRGIDLYSAGRVDLLLEWAGLHITSGEVVLDQFDAEWRGRYRREFETYTAGDDNLSIRRRG